MTLWHEVYLTLYLSFSLNFSYVHISIRAILSKLSNPFHHLDTFSQPQKQNSFSIMITWYSDISCKKVFVLLLIEYIYEPRVEHFGKIYFFNKLWETFFGYHKIYFAFWQKTAEKNPTCSELMMENWKISALLLDISGIDWYSHSEC